ncbi:LIM and senescent cell antigen-like-containing domain protein 1 isoform X2 [Anopheles bellator]|uniref:LIM and senescent cell antigen-like-containing domain protein 1 isoform X2 n=1 Tax=Anopheles bellator TaxID=139047 RepID=UPI00264993DD|nr:LIM and senescent cell antigen-like-containing domain protein 1 isoform X2 [Anopheles bellator]
MSALKLKPLEDSNLYKRRATSKENLIHPGGLGSAEPTSMAAEFSMLQSPTAATKPSYIGSYPTPAQLECYYQQPKSPITVQPAGATGSSQTPSRSTNVLVPQGLPPGPGTLTPAVSTGPSKHPYYSNSTGTVPHSANRATGPPQSGVYQNVLGGRPEPIEKSLVPSGGGAGGNLSIPPVQQRAYQNLPFPSLPQTPDTPGKRMESREQFGRTHLQSVVTATNMSLDTMHCTRCDEGFEPHERIVNSNGQLWHTQCFVCAQCFRQFQDGIFYEFEGRKYCEKDFHILFAPCCNKCNNFVIGRVIKAMAANWHPQCFTCELCSVPLADSGFIRNQNRALCHDCNRHVKNSETNTHTCNKCHGNIEGKPLRFRGEVYHGYHFNCTACGTELDSTAREVKNRSGYAANDMNELYCLRCHDRMGIPICGACRRPIEERVVTALGKHWHVEHFVCAKCEKPFLGHRHYEKRGLAYCETHYHQLFGNLCFVCNQVIAGDVFTALNKAWCVHHFSCSICDQKLDQKSKFFEYDEKPVCKKCYERFPPELRRRLRISHENTLKKAGP